MTHNVPRFAIVTSKSATDAIARLQTIPLLKYGNENEVDIIEFRPESGLNAEQLLNRIAVFHYDDKFSVNVIRELSEKHADFLSICLGSDIYSIAEYQKIDEFASAFIMPTILHRNILSLNVISPVFFCNECIDTVATESRSQVREISLNFESKKVVWFGYPESFAKGVAPLLPAIKMALEKDHIDSFTVCTDIKRVEFIEGINFIDYKLDSFSITFREYDYCLLSHIPVDMHLNSFIKSPNKLVTSLVLGVVPLVSNTPSYEEVMRGCGLDRFVFSSPTSFAHLLENLSPSRDKLEVGHERVRSYIEDNFSINTLFDKINEVSYIINNQDHSEKGRLYFGKYVSFRELSRTPFKEHLTDIFPSAIRAIKRRLKLSIQSLRASKG